MDTHVRVRATSGNPDIRRATIQLLIARTWPKALVVDFGKRRWYGKGRHSAFDELRTRFGAGRRDAGDAFEERKVGPERLRGRWSVGKRVMEHGYPLSRRTHSALSDPRRWRKAGAGRLRDQAKARRQADTPLRCLSSIRSATSASAAGRPTAWPNECSYCATVSSQASCFTSK